MIPTAKELHNIIATKKEIAELIDIDRVRVENALSDAVDKNRFSVDIKHNIHMAVVHELRELGYTVYLGIVSTNISFREPKNSIR